LFLKKDYMIKEIFVPQGIEVSQEGQELVVKGPKGELRRKLSHPKVKVKISGSNTGFDSIDDRRRSKSMTGTFAAHLRNMINGVSKGYESRLKVIYSHFPVRIKAEGTKLIIENFLGEKRPRIANAMPGTEIRVEKDEIIVTGPDKEGVGITASRIERATHITGYDRRVFSDGIYITKKPAVVGGEAEAEVQKVSESEEQAEERKDGSKK